MTAAVFSVFPGEPRLLSQERLLLLTISIYQSCKEAWQLAKLFYNNDWYRIVPADSSNLLIARLGLFIRETWQTSVELNGSLKPPL